MLAVKEVNTVISIGNLISIERFNDTTKLLKVTAIVMESVASKHFINTRYNNTENIQKAEIC